MFKQSITYCIMSIIIILLKSYIASGLSYFNAGYQWFASMAAPLLQQAGLNNQLQTIVLIVLFPFLLVGIPGGLYYITKKKQMPYFMEATWSLWLVVILSHVLMPHSH